FNIATGLILACPVTNQVKGGSFEVPLPAGDRVTGVVLSEQVRSVDWIARRAEFHSKAPEDTLWNVLGRIEAILGLT
ncbi:MAG: mRNA-degrading endonuclease, partial [Xanthomonadales bacterium]|nr:mRNA-degrading endonuclease [Xanthomonadales bacterium]